MEGYRWLMAKRSTMACWQCERCGWLVPSADMANGLRTPCFNCERMRPLADALDANVLLRTQLAERDLRITCYREAMRLHCPDALLGFDALVPAARSGEGE